MARAKRDTDPSDPLANDPDDAGGDGPLTTTTTPAAVVSTETDDGGTVTQTSTSYVTSTSTVLPTPAIVTIFTGKLDFLQCLTSTNDMIS